MNIKDGTVIMCGRNGKFIPFRSYTRRERAVRWVGRKLHLRHLARWHERIPIGVVMGGRCVTSGVVQVRMK